MVSFTHPPDYLDRLRTDVTSWMRTGVMALYECYEAEGPRRGFFRSNSREDAATHDTGRHFTTTARAYAALARVDQVIGLKALVAADLVPLPKNQSLPDDLHLDNVVKSVNEDPNPLLRRSTTLHLARVADLVFAAKYFKEKVGSARHASREVAKDIIDKITDQLNRIIIAELQPGRSSPFDRGEFALEPSNDNTRHYYVTLQVARARYVLGNGIDGTRARLVTNEQLAYLTNQVRSYGIEQSFYAEQDVQYRHDAVKHAMATALYCMFSTRADTELCVDFVRAIARSQLPNGAWSATHPIIREGVGPWHISSHELGLALTWIYYQPQVPDAAREIVLDVLERYFRNWVIPTFVQEAVKKLPTEGKREKLGLPGWFDDHTVAPTNTEGWATATVVHFLANYCTVLDDHINRRVIENLHICDNAAWYAIDKTASEERRSQRWCERKPDRSSDENATDDIVPELWPDLPPNSFLWKPASEEELQQHVTAEWLDPSKGARGSTELVKQLVHPILANPKLRPEPHGYRAGILPGSPGTGKTTLVRTIAKLLKWPYIAVPSCVFFTRGFDASEVRATEVFEQLYYLDRCVIFFDEFEEFFRDRSTPAEGNWPVHDRTIAAFTTAAMLPRLQTLYDKRRCVVILATNFPGRIDKAVKRRGRFDFQFCIAYPTPTQAKLFMNLKTVRQTEEVKNLVRKAIDSAFGPDADQKPMPELQIGQLQHALAYAEELHRDRGNGDDVVREIAKRLTEFSDDLPDLGEDLQDQRRRNTTDCP